MMIVAEREEIIRHHLTLQSQRLRATPEPLAQGLLSLLIIVAHRQVFPEITFGIPQIVLSLRRDHGQRMPQGTASFCVSPTQNAQIDLLHFAHENERISITWKPAL